MTAGADHRPVAEITPANSSICEYSDNRQFPNRQSILQFPIGESINEHTLNEHSGGQKP
jgi:hypothetical protein